MNAGNMPKSYDKKGMSISTCLKTALPRKRECPIKICMWKRGVDNAKHTFQVETMLGKPFA